MIREELINLLLETEDENEPGLVEVLRNAKDPKETVVIIKKYEDMLKGQNKKNRIA